MSLQHAAQHLAAQGRGPDTQLIHMSPREVAGLQALAMAHGGSLSINPETGLPEAGVLDNLLPAIIGAGLAFATGGTSLAATGGLFGLGMPATIGLGVGALQTARTGDLGKGIMAGLGAYGGAGLGAGLAGPGMTVTNPQAAQIATAQTAPVAQAGVAGTAGLPAAPYEFGAATAAEQAAMQNALTAPAASANPYGVLDPSTYADYFPGMGTGTPSAALGGTPISAEEHLQAMSKLSGPPMMAAPVAPAASTANLMSPVELTGTPPPSGLQALKAMPGKDLAKYGLAAAAPVLMAEPEDERPELDREQMRFAYNPGRVADPYAGYTGASTGERRYFQPQYVRLAEGGLLNRGTGGSADDNRYTYDPLTQSYKKVEPPKPTKAGDSGRTMDSGGAGGDLAAAGSGLAGLAAAALASGVGDQAIGAFDAASQGASAADAVGMSGFDGAGGAVSGSDLGAAGADTGGVGAMGLGLGSGDTAGIGGDAAFARGGVSHLGDYSDGGRLLRGPGDGVSDSIPATIANKRPARLADGEFVIPARIVSELGNGSTEAGARKLYAMMDRVQRARGKTTGKGKVAKNTRSDKYLPA